MTKDQYQEYLKSDHWKRTRKSKLRHADYQCERCGSSIRLEVHHLHYRTLWNEAMSDLECLCHDHHHEQHHPWETTNWQKIDADLDKFMREFQ